VVVVLIWVVGRDGGGRGEDGQDGRGREMHFESLIKETQWKNLEIDGWKQMTLQEYTFKNGKDALEN
jgi:hypothetical protein